MINISASKALVGIIVILVGIGLLLGLGLVDSDLVNPISSISDYQRAGVETQRAAQQNEIDLRQYEAVQEARTQAEIQKLEEEVQYLQQLHEQELENSQRAHEQKMRQNQEWIALEQQLLRLAGRAAIVVFGLYLLSLSIGFSVHFAKRRPMYAEADADVWTPERKRQAIKAARWRERERREQELREQELRQQELDLQERLRELCSTTIGSNGHEDLDELFSEPSPLWIYS
jgi:uncharacterized membrane protein YccC